MQITFESFLGFDEDATVTVTAEVEWHAGERRTLEYPGALAGWGVCDLSATMNGVELDLSREDYESLCDDAIEFADKNL